MRNKIIGATLVALPSAFILGVGAYYAGPAFLIGMALALASIGSIAVGVWMVTDD